MTHHVLKVATDAGKDRVHDVMSQRFDDLRWNRGDSGIQQAWYVTSRGAPASTKIWGFEDEPGVVYVDIWDDSPDPPPDDVAAWQQAHLRRVAEAALTLGPPVSASEALLPILAGLGHESVEVEPMPARRER